MNKIAKAHGLRKPMPGNSDLLLRGLARQLERATPDGVGSASPRTHYACNIQIGGRRLRVVHNISEGAVMIAGVTFDAAELPPEARGLLSALARLDEAITEEEIGRARLTVESLIVELLQRRPDLDRAIRAREFADTSTSAHG